MIITKDFLIRHQFSESDISFFERNFPVALFPNGLDLDKIKITGNVSNLFFSLKQLPLTRYGYNSKGMVYEKEIVPGKFSTYSYDSQDRLIEYNLSSGRSEIYNYDAEGRIEKVVTFRGKSIVLTYDKYDRVTKLVFDGTNVYTYTYKNNFKIKTFPDGKKHILEHDDIGNLIKAIYHNNKVYHYEYDKNRNMVKEIRPDGMQICVVYKYDFEGRLIKYMNMEIEYLE
jgi:YD repeat-containing protein